MIECTYCEKEFDEDESSDREFDDFTLDEQWNDVPITRHQYLCPHCETWTEGK